jgi:hypothetical protein
MNMQARMVAFFLSATVAQAIAAEAGAKRIHLSDYQSFVRNWSPEETPLCAAMDSQADWDAVMRPAPTMGQTRPFSPPEAFWKRNSLLVLARVINSGGDDLDVFQVGRVVRSKSKITIDYNFSTPPAASSQIKATMALEIAKPLPSVIEFKENGRMVCALRPDKKQIVSPPPAN